MPAPLGSASLRDVDGTPIPVHSRVEQVMVDKNHGALLSRLHMRGQVVGWGTHLLYVRFEFMCVSSTGTN
jgi:hypothetical protein